MHYKDQDVDFLEIFHFLWRGKWKIILSIIASLILGIIYLTFEDEVYESTISFDVNMIPPNISGYSYYNEFRVLEDLENLFYSEDFFIDWNQTSKSTISYENIKPTKIINGVNFKNKNNLIELILNSSNKSKKISSTLIIYTNDFNTINRFQNYLLKINEKLKNQYLSLADKEINDLKQLILENDTVDKDNLNRLEAKIFPLYKFKSLLNENKNIINIEPPTVPYKVSPNIKRYLLTFFIFGLFFGIAYIYLLSFIKAYHAAKEPNQSQ